MKNQQFINVDGFDSELNETIQRIASVQASTASVSSVAEIAKQYGASPVTPAIERRDDSEIPRIRSGAFRFRRTLVKWGTIAAAAACLVIFWSVAFSSSENNLFANMQSRLREVFAIGCTSDFYRPDEPLPWKTCEYSFLDDRLFREDRSAPEMGEAVSVLDLEKGVYGSWYPATKKGVVGKVANIDMVRIQYDLFMSILLNLDAQDAAIVDRFQRDGISIVEYELPVTYPNGETLSMNVMVDRATTLPVEIHFLDGEGNVMRTLTNIKFDQEFDPDLFLTDPPKGYDVTTQDIGE